MKNLWILLSLVVALTLTGNVVSASEYGTREQAEAMLERAVAVLKADKRRALDLFTAGHGGFKDRDLYVFCGGPDGMLSAHPYFMGGELRDFKDITEEAVGEKIYAAAEEGKFSEVTYKWLRPGGTDEQVDKVSFVTKVGDQVCGVGYYKQ